MEHSRFAKTLVICVLVLLSVLSFPALGADPDPLDTALDACLAKPEALSTPGMVELHRRGHPGLGQAPKRSL